MSKRERHRDGEVTKDAPAKAELSRPLLDLKDFRDSNKWKDCSKSKKMPPYFDLIDDNLYLTERY
jgi:histone-lysine N-methyltransferase SETD2